MHAWANSSRQAGSQSLAPPLSARLKVQMHGSRCTSFAHALPPRRRPQAIAVLSRASQEVRSSSLMKHLLKLALEIGNFLNCASAQGSAVGFHVEALLKLRDVRSSKNKGQTLLHFVARWVGGGTSEGEGGAGNQERTVWGQARRCAAAMLPLEGSAALVSATATTHVLPACMPDPPVGPLPTRRHQRRQYPDAMLKDELSSAHAASKCSLTLLAADLATMQSDLDKARGRASSDEEELTSFFQVCVRACVSTRRHACLPPC